MFIRSIDNFLKGMNDTSPSNLLEDNELRICDNVNVLAGGGLQKRAGMSKINSNSLNSNITQYIEWILKDGTSRHIILLNGTIGEMNISTGVFTPKQTVSTDRVAYSFFTDFLYIFGNNQAWKWSNVDNSIVAMTIPSEIKSCKYIEYHPRSAYFFASGNPSNPSAVYYSTENSIESWDVATRVLFPSRNSGPVRGLISIEESMVVAYDLGIFTFSGTDTDVGKWGKIPVPAGCKSGDTMQLTPQGLMFLSKTGIWNIDRSLLNVNLDNALTDLAVNITDNRLEKAISSIKNLEKTKSMYFDNEYYLFYNDTSNSDVHNKCIKYSFKTGALVMYSDLNLYDVFATNDNTVLVSARNFLLKWDILDNILLNDIDVLTGNEKEIVYKVKTKPFNLGRPTEIFNTKYLNRFFFSAQQYELYECKSNINIKSDYVDTTNNNQILDESLVWGKKYGSIWGWNDVVNLEMLVFKPAQRHEVTFTGTGLNNPFLLHNMAFEYELMLSEVKRLSEAININTSDYIR